MLEGTPLRVVSLSKNQIRPCWTVCTGISWYFLLSIYIYIYIMKSHVCHWILPGFDDHRMTIRLWILLKDLLDLFSGVDIKKQYLSQCKVPGTSANLENSICSSVLHILRHVSSRLWQDSLSTHPRWSDTVWPEEDETKPVKKYLIFQFHRILVDFSCFFHVSPSVQWICLLLMTGR